MPIFQALHIYLFICLFVSTLFIDGPKVYDGRPPFVHIGTLRHLHMNEQMTVKGQSSLFLFRFQQLK